jgi:hypothetical protein
MKHDLKNLCNDGLINSCKKIAELIPTQLEADHLTELITRFERLSLGKQADEAIRKAEELQQPTLQVGWEYQDGRGEWMPIIEYRETDHYPFKSGSIASYTHKGVYNKSAPNSEFNLILSTGRPVKKVQIDDEVEALAEKFWLLPDNPTLENCFANAERFIQYRNERRGKK